MAASTRGVIRQRGGRTSPRGLAWGYTAYGPARETLSDEKSPARKRKTSDAQRISPMSCHCRTASEMDGTWRGALYRIAGAADAAVPDRASSEDDDRRNGIDACPSLIIPIQRRHPVIEATKALFSPTTPAVQNVFDSATQLQYHRTQQDARPEKATRGETDSCSCRVTQRADPDSIGLGVFRGLHGMVLCNRHRTRHGARKGNNTTGSGSDRSQNRTW